MPDFARSDHPGVQQQLDRLARLSPGDDRLGLDRITRLLERLGRPQDRLPPTFHVAGTNGKGSTCAFLRAALEAAGHRVHVFTSPHLVRFNERIRLAGRLIADEDLAALLSDVLDASGEIEPSFFEVATAAAFLAFAQSAADALVLEVGLGGRLDATNVIQRPLVCGIASLGLDHQQWLGRRLIDIAGEKAGIAKPGVPLVTQCYPPPVLSRIREVAQTAGAPVLARDEAWEAREHANGISYRDATGGLILPEPQLAGRHQTDNAALAVAMLRHQAALPVASTALSLAMTYADWPARLQRLRPGPLVESREVWLDGGHNPAAARQLARAMRSRAPFTLVIGCLRNKDARGLLKPFGGLAANAIAVPVPDHDCFSPDELAKIARSMGIDASACPTVAAALADAPPDCPILIAGSLYLAGEVLRLNDQVPG